MMIRVYVYTVEISTTSDLRCVSRLQLSWSKSFYQLTLYSVAAPLLKGVNDPFSVFVIVYVPHNDSGAQTGVSNTWFFQIRRQSRVDFYAVVTTELVIVEVRITNMSLDKIRTDSHHGFAARNLNEIGTSKCSSSSAA
jgi:hypothetical protein